MSVARHVARVKVLVLSEYIAVQDYYQAIVVLQHWHLILCLCWPLSLTWGVECDSWACLLIPRSPSSLLTLREFLW